MTVEIGRARYAGVDTNRETGSLLDPKYDAAGLITAVCTAPDGTVLEEFVSDVEGRGMQFQALAAEEIIAGGATDSERLPIDETVAIMETLDAVRRQIGLRYPEEQ